MDRRTKTGSLSRDNGKIDFKDNSIEGNRIKKQGDKTYRYDNCGRRVIMMGIEGSYIYRYNLEGQLARVYYSYKRIGVETTTFDKIEDNYEYEANGFELIEKNLYNNSGLRVYKLTPPSPLSSGKEGGETLYYRTPFGFLGTKDLTSGKERLLVNYMSSIDGATANFESVTKSFGSPGGNSYQSAMSGYNGGQFGIERATMNQKISATTDGQPMGEIKDGEIVKWTTKDETIKFALFEDTSLSNTTIKVATGFAKTNVMNYHKDQIGSVRMVTEYDEATNNIKVVLSGDYKPFGEIMTEDYQLNWLPLKTWALHEYDKETGLYYAQARFYDPNTAQFISEDGAMDGTNWYGYCGNMPLLGVDPNGMAFIMGFAGTWYYQSQFGGSPNNNFTNPMPNAGWMQKNWGFGNGGNNDVFNRLNNIFDPGSKMNSDPAKDWGGQNADYSMNVHKGRKDTDSSVWAKEYKDGTNNGKTTGIITGFSHGNQVAIGTINTLYNNGFDLSNTIFVSFSYPNRSDTKLNQDAANSLKGYINIYNINDQTAGPRGWAGTDILDKDMKGGKLGNQYVNNALNFEVHADEFWANNGIVESHSIPLSQKILESVQTFLTDNPEYITKQGLINVDVDKYGNVVVTPNGDTIKDREKPKVKLPPPPPEDNNSSSSSGNSSSSGSSGNEKFLFIILIIIMLLIIFKLTKKHKKKIVIFLCIILGMNIFCTENKDEKVYLRIKKSIDKVIKYNIKNIPLQYEVWGIVYFWAAYDKFNFYLFKDNKYIGNESDDYDTILEVSSSSYNYSSFPPRITPEKERYLSGKIFGFDNNKLILIKDVIGNYSKKIDNIDLSFLETAKGDHRIREIKYNKEGYIENGGFNTSGYPYSFNIYLPDCSYQYEYYSDGYNYEGKNKIKKIIRTYDKDINQKEIYNIEYDNLGRIIKIEKILDYYLKESKYNIYYYFYQKNDCLFIVEKDNIFSPDNIISCKIFNKYGYYDKDGIDIPKNTKINELNTYEELKEEVSKIKIKKYQNSYIYEKANPEYKDNLKIQQLFLDPKDFTENYLGIFNWYRYKYLNDKKEE